MKTFYTILKLSPNTIVGDTLSIGLLVCSGSKYWLKISDYKKNIAKKLLGKNENAVDFAIKQLSNYLKKLNIESKNNNLFTFESFITKDYIDYLNVYANGILQFSKSLEIADHFSDAKFSKLYELLIQENAQQKSISNQNVNVFVENDFEQKIQHNLIKKVENQIHTEITMDDSVLKSLYFNYNLDCIGLNGSFVGAKSLSFNLTVPTLEKSISHYVTLIAMLSQQYKKDLNKNKFFLITNEPLQKSAEHDFWTEIRDVPTFKLISLDEIEEVTSIVEQTGATTFL